ncbi:MAG: putative endonuclease 4 [Pirellulaceae bacterium]|nr:MAG: putative endonuclease 4 [Pirellulaceae bacterium]
MAKRQSRERLGRSIPGSSRRTEVQIVSAGPPWIGAHLSIAGGVDRAPQEAVRLGMNTFQVFTASPQIWPVRPGPGRARRSWGDPDVWQGSWVDADQAARFRQLVAQHGLYRPIAHSCYLVNLAASDGQLWGRSVAALVWELRRAGQLGLTHLVVHPGAATDGDEQQALVRVAEALNEVFRRRSNEDARLMLENTAGQGNCLGWRFDHLARILERLDDPDWVDVCIDTCHAFAAGYDLRTPEGWQQVKRELAATIGLEKIQAWHTNDSKRELGSRVDRHEHIGKGHLGIDAFRWLLADPRFRQIPMYLETPKGRHGRRSWDEWNLRTLRKCAADPPET